MVPSVGDPAPVGLTATALVTVPAAGTTATRSPRLPVAWKTTGRASPTKSLLLPTAAMTGDTPGVTSNVETTPRWSVGHGVNGISTSGPPASPTTRPAPAAAGP